MQHQLCVRCDSDPENGKLFRLNFYYQYVLTYNIDRLKVPVPEVLKLHWSVKDSLCVLTVCNFLIIIDEQVVKL